VRSSRGSNVSTFGDDFTVATALEDLEFGFSIITSAQKVRKQAGDIRLLSGDSCFWSRRYDI